MPKAAIEHGDSYTTLQHKGQRIVKVSYKPQYLIVEDNGEVLHSFNSLKGCKKFIDSFKGEESK